MGGIPSLGNPGKVQPMVSIQTRRLIPIVVLGYVLSVFAIAPGVVAQTPADHPMQVAVTFKPNDETGLNGPRLPPESAAVKYDVIATVTYPQITGCVTVVSVTFKPTPKANYITAVISPTTITQTADFTTGGTPSGPAQGIVGAAGGKQDFKTLMTITTTRQAPALQDLQVDIKADAVAGTTSQGNCNLGTGSNTGTFTIKNDYLALMQYAPTAYILKTGQNKAVNFGIKMTNFGNGPTKVKIKADMPGKNKLESLVPPADQRLLSRATDGAQAKVDSDIIIQARTPHSNGYTNSFYNVLATFDAAYDGNLVGGTPSTDTQAVTLSVQVQGVYVPGFDAVSIIGAMAIALGAFGVTRRPH